MIKHILFEIIKYVWVYAYIHLCIQTHTHMTFYNASDTFKSNHTHTHIRAITARKCYGIDTMK